MLESLFLLCLMSHGEWEPSQQRGVSVSGAESLVGGSPLSWYFRSCRTKWECELRLTRLSRAGTGGGDCVVINSEVLAIIGVGSCGPQLQQSCQPYICESPRWRPRPQHSCLP